MLTEAPLWRVKFVLDDGRLVYFTLNRRYIALLDDAECAQLARDFRTILNHPDPLVYDADLSSLRVRSQAARSGRPYHHILLFAREPRGRRVDGRAFLLGGSPAAGAPEDRIASITERRQP